MDCVICSAINISCRHKSPVSTKFPEPECVLKLSWEDIVSEAYEKYDIVLDEGQVRELFDSCKRGMSKSDVVMSGFWAVLDEYIGDKAI